MKYIFFAALLGSATVRAEPAEFVKKCYQDYVQSLLNEKPEKVRVGIRKRCLSADFNKRWKREVTAQDADPFVFGQDTPESWKDVSVQMGGSTTSNATVTLGTGEEKQCLIVNLENKGQTISSVVPCSK